VPHLTTHGTTFYYQQTGQGPDVVLIHAVTSNLAVWMFINMLDTLGKEFRVTAYDMRGHGLSDAPPTGYTSLDMAHDFAHIHESLNLHRAILVGHSFGGVVALHAALLHPDRVAGVILADSYFPGLAHIEPNLAESNVWQDLRATFSTAGIDIGNDVNFTHLFRLVADLRPEQMATVKKAMGPASGRWLTGLPRLAQTTCGREAFETAGLTAEAIASVQQSVVALYDEHTPFATTRDWLAKHLKRCTVDVVPGAKHLAPIQNAPAFVERVQHNLRAIK